MSVIEHGDRRWTLQGMSAYGAGHPLIVAKGPWPREAVEVVPAEQLAWAVAERDALREALGLLASVCQPHTMERYRELRRKRGLPVTPWGQ